MTERKTKGIVRKLEKKKSLKRIERSNKGIERKLEKKKSMKRIEITIKKKETGERNRGGIGKSTFIFNILTT